MISQSLLPQINNLRTVLFLIGVMIVMSISMTGSAFAISYDTPETLVNPNPDTGNPEASGDNFGKSVSVLGNNVLVSSDIATYLYNLNDGMIQKKFDNLRAPIMLTDKFVVGKNNQGMIDIYDVSTGNLLKTIDNSGDSIFVSGNNILLGTSTVGITYLYDVNGNLLQTFKNPVNSTESTSFTANIGNSLSISGNTVIIGAPLTNVNKSNGAGAVYLFDKISGKLVRTISNPEPQERAFFGESITSYGNNVLVGAPAAESAYMFDITTGNWLKTFQKPQNYLSHGFGGVVALDQNYVLISSPPCGLSWQENACSPPTGKIFLFDSTTGNLLKTFFNPKESTELIQYQGYIRVFGISVSMSNGIIVVGTPGYSPHNGEAFVFFPISQPHYPTLNVPTSDYVVQPSTAGTAIVSYSVQGRDSKLNVVDVDCKPSSGSVFLKGTTTVTCSATDAGGNTGTASFKVIVGNPSTTNAQNIGTNNTQTSSTTSSKLPSWVRNDFKYYGDGQLSEDSFFFFVAAG